MLYVANMKTSDLTILTFPTSDAPFDDDLSVSTTFTTTRLSDRAKYHYMASVSSLSFDATGRFATCQESTNTYDGLTATGGDNGNMFMGPTLFDSSESLRVDSMGSLSKCGKEKNSTCFLRHIDMLHESPSCMGIVHDDEVYQCPGKSTFQKNVYWSFDGHGKGEQRRRLPKAEPAPDGEEHVEKEEGDAEKGDEEEEEKGGRKGMLMRYDFERDHGGCNGYLCADHGEAEVRRYEDVILTRAPGIPSHLVMDGRDLWIADTGGGRLLRVDADSGRSDRTAIYEYPIYSSTHLHFNYKIWTCTVYETVLGGNASPSSLRAAGMEEEDIVSFLPSGIVIDGHLVYVSNHATGNILAVDKYTGNIVRTLKTGRLSSLAGLEMRKGKSKHLFVLDQNRGELLRVAPSVASSDDASSCSTSTTTQQRRPRRPYPKEVGTSVNTCLAASSSSVSVPKVGEAIEHDPGYMNIAIPKNYGMNNDISCHDKQTKKSNFNLDAILMAGHTCHRCLPEPCHNGGVCKGVQESGFTCVCPESSSGDLCQEVDGKVVEMEDESKEEEVEELMPKKELGVAEEDSLATGSALSSCERATMSLAALLAICSVLLI